MSPYMLGGHYRPGMLQPQMGGPAPMPQGGPAMSRPMQPQPFHAPQFGGNAPQAPMMLTGGYSAPIQQPPAPMRAGGRGPMSFGGMDNQMLRVPIRWRGA